MDIEWLSALLAIIAVDLLLAGDNAVVIALATHRLPPKLQQRAIIWGTLGAVIFRLIFVFFISYLLQIKFLGIIGGVLLFFIAWRLLGEKKNESGVSATGFWGAMKTIIIADAVMSLDNVLAIAGAAQGDWILIIIGLTISVPIVIFGSRLLLRVMDRFPWIIVLGAGLLVGIAMRIILDDAWLQATFELPSWIQWALTLSVTAIFLIIQGLLYKSKP